jgi:hypothetical protein
MPPKTSDISASLAQANALRIKNEREEAIKLAAAKDKQEKALVSACGGHRPPRGTFLARKRHCCVQAIYGHQLLRIAQGTA